MIIKNCFVAEILILLLIPAGLNAQFENDSNIFWKNKRPLKWSDFQGDIPVNHGKDQAISYIGIQTTFIKEGNSIDVKATCSFNKVRSWKRDTSLWLLKHEQLHFDIAELYSRKIRKAVLDLRNANQTNIEEYRILIRTLLKEYNCVDDEYDKDTAHSINKLQQEAWEKKIKKNLEEFKNYQ